MLRCFLRKINRPQEKISGKHCAGKFVYAFLFFPPLRFSGELSLPAQSSPPFLSTGKTCVSYHVKDFTRCISNQLEWELTLKKLPHEEQNFRPVGLNRKGLTLSHHAVPRIQIRPNFKITRYVLTWLKSVTLEG